jgi:putative membrane protein
MNLKKKKSDKKLAKIILAISIISVMFVPMLYSTIYLGAIWDAYGKIDNVPVAFVNLDKPFTKDGKVYAAGEELVNNLKGNSKVAWKFVDYKTAMKGVKGTDYYAVIEIPEDFSKKIANSQDGKFSSPEIVYTANKGRNFIFSQISEKVAQSIKTEVGSNIQKEISKALVGSLYDVKVSIKDAGNGAAELQAGQQKFLTGSKKLESGVQKAASDSAKLGSGLNNASAASGKLQAGTQKLFDGSIALSNGLNTTAVGSKGLEAGLESISDSERKVVDGSVVMVGGLKELKTNLAETNNQIPVLVKGASDVNNNTALIEQGAMKLNTSLYGLNSLADGVKQVSDGISQASNIMNSELDNIKNSNLSQADKDKLAAAILSVDKVHKANMSDSIEAPLRKAANSAQPLVSSLKLLTGGTNQISEGVSQLANAIDDNQSKAVEGLDKLVTGAEGIQSGSSRILDGLNTITTKTGKLANGLGQINSASVVLKNGLENVNGGNNTLTSGLNTAAAKTGELSGGLKQLSGGTSSL